MYVCFESGGLSVHFFDLLVVVYSCLIATFPRAHSLYKLASSQKRLKGDCSKENVIFIFYTYKAALFQDMCRLK